MRLSLLPLLFVSSLSFADGFVNFCVTGALPGSDSNVYYNYEEMNALFKAANENYDLPDNLIYDDRQCFGVLHDIHRAKSLNLSKEFITGTFGLNLTYSQATSIDLSQNFLNYVKLSNLSHLESLNVSHNYIRSSLSSFEIAKGSDISINASYNYIDSYNFLYTLSESVISIDISHNKLDDKIAPNYVDDVSRSGHNIKYLNISHNGLKGLTALALLPDEFFPEMTAELVFPGNNIERTTESCPTDRGPVSLRNLCAWWIDGGELTN